MNDKAVTVYLPEDVKKSLSAHAKTSKISMSKLLEFTWRWFGSDTLEHLKQGQRPEVEQRGPQCQKKA
jgi:hypothetical protein